MDGGGPAYKTAAAHVSICHARLQPVGRHQIQRSLISGGFKFHPIHSASDNAEIRCFWKKDFGAAGPWKLRWSRTRSWVCLLLSKHPLGISEHEVLESQTAPASTIVTSLRDDYVQCERTVKNWAALSFSDRVEGDKLNLRDLLFFLHVPRTGGRTYYHCFLRKLYTGDQECPRSYDKLRFDPSKPNCRLMVTHDDYSMVSKLAKESTSVVTILRNPVDRIFSTYEFSVEVAARFLVHPNLTSATKMERQPRPKSFGVSTLDIWPWKYLVPWMRVDLFSRRDHRKIERAWESEEIRNPYDIKDIAMPLHEFINQPIAHDIIHNGATFQVAGLTNNSCLAGSHEVRHCVRRHPSLGEYVLDVAKKRLDDMLYVGLTEDHKESATMFANMVGVQVLSLLEALSSNSRQATNNDTELDSYLDSSPNISYPLLSGTGDQNASAIPPTTSAETSNENMTVTKLMEAYEVCISSLRKSQSVRRINSLKRIAPVNFSKEARVHVPGEIVEQILSLNSLDMELYKHAQNIFSQQRKHLSEKLRKSEIENHIWTSSLGSASWKVLSLSIAGLIFISLAFFLVTRRTSKLKV